jgi:branched-chain amino acid transport system permease protein
MASEAVPAPVPAEPARWRPSSRGWAARGIVMAVVLGALLFLLITMDGLWADRVSLAAIYVIIGLSLNVVLGYTGQVSLGHHAFVGLAAFVAAHHLTVRAGCLPEEGCTQSSLTAFFVALALGVLSGTISAGLLGLVALRIKGLYLALITLVYGFVAVNALFEIPFLTRGGAGMPAPRPELFISDHAYMTLCLIFVALVLFIDWRMLASKMGRAVLAVKESEAVAASYAVNVTVYKVMAFMLSGAFAGLAGALFASRRQIVVAADFGFATALLWVLMVVVGGLGSRLGVLIGSAFFALFPFLVQLVGPLNHFVESTMKRDPEEFTLVIGPLLALLTMIQFPGGIAEQISPITRWLGGQRFAMHPEGKHKKEGHGLLGRFKKTAAEETDEVTASGKPLHTTNGGDAAATPPPSPPGGSSTETEELEITTKEGR